MAVVCVKEAAISGALPVRDLNPGEHRSLQFFAERTVKQMVTFFPDELWSTVVLRLAHSEPSIMHALVAFSSYHERFLCSTANQDEEAGAEFSLQQYNKAIRYRLDALQSGQSLEKEFITCLIFICIEILRGKHGAAIQLFMVGHELIKNYRDQQEKSGQRGRDPEEIMAVIEPAFVRIAVQASQLVGDVDPRLSIEAIPAFEVPVKPVDTPFDSLFEAREAMVALAVKCLRSSSVEDIISTRGMLEKWIRSFDVFLLSSVGSPKSQSERRGAALLKLQHRFLTHRMATCHVGGLTSMSDNELDGSIEVFREMISYAALALGLDETEGGSNKNPMTISHTPPSPHFHIDVGAVPILFAISARCRHSSIRRDAIRLMRDSGIQDGMWSGALAARVAQRIANLEEMDMGDAGQSFRSIPKEFRVQYVFAQFDSEERSATVKYEKKDSKLEEVITW